MSTLQSALSGNDIKPVTLKFSSLLRYPPSLADHRDQGSADVLPPVKDVSGRTLAARVPSKAARVV